MTSSPKQTLHEALADNANPELIGKISTGIEKWQNTREGKLHPHANLAKIGSLLYLAAYYLTQFMDEPAGKSAAGTLAEYLVDQVDVHYRNRSMAEMTDEELEAEMKRRKDKLQ